MLAIELIPAVVPTWDRLLTTVLLVLVVVVVAEVLVVVVVAVVAFARGEFGALTRLDATSAGAEVNEGICDLPGLTQRGFWLVWSGDGGGDELACVFACALSWEMRGFGCCSNWLTRAAICGLRPVGVITLGADCVALPCCCSGGASLGAGLPGRFNKGTVARAGDGLVGLVGLKWGA